MKQASETFKVYLWPSGTWSTEEDLSDYLVFMSDDYRTITIPHSHSDLLELYLEKLND